ncbi:hypothetical protein RB614_39575 [Phytohabitans sp. ZYX-F-186]|uniref:PknH-like extracellular domain-containing protein n=1 Tax=Phytohabitans maris TaxID=3071409 RepID=A0ABU0ZUI3_9ACTN|nr:hypothetical protein [Phytohabitans sp. ZYX-F-186]MDQ7910613.1 hypothetical protein [Phytohabitans sp. ZYX-F-186]
MSELDRAFRALSQRADTVRLAGPSALRARADRRTRVRVTAVTVAAAVAVGGAVVGTQWVFRAGGSSPAPLPPAATPSWTPPAPSASPTPRTSAPAPPPTTPSRPAAPKSIPNSAFLQVADTNGREPVVDTPSEEIVPALCDARFASDRDVDLRRSRRVTYWNAPNREGYVPDGTFRQTISVYEAGRASRFLDELRAAVADCPTDGDRRHRLVSATERGDESLAFEVRYPTLDVEGRSTGGQDVRLVSVVRIGDVVTILYETGWEAGWSAEPAVVDGFTGKAVDRIRSWLD